MSDTVEFIRYVRREHIAAYLALGWKAVPVRRTVHHDFYSILMVFAGSGSPVEPVTVAA